MMLRIGEFARRGRVSVKALRHYEAIGLLRPAHVDAATGYRSYEADQLDDLHRVMVLRALGLSLERIRQVLQDDPSPERMRRLLDERRAAVARRIDAEQAQLAAIEARIRHLEGDRDAAPAPWCGMCRRPSWPACAVSCRTTASSIRCSTRSPAPCPTPPASPATARSGITARRTSDRSIARRWCCWSGRCRHAT